MLHLLFLRDKRGIELLYQQYADILYYKISRIITEKDFANEIFQKTFTSIWERYSTFNPDREFFYEWVKDIALTEVEVFYARFDIVLPNEDVAHFDENSIIELFYFGNYTREEVAEKFSITI